MVPRSVGNERRELLEALFVLTKQPFGDAPKLWEEWLDDYRKGVLQAFEFGKRLPVILMTSFGTEETASEARAAGAFDCLLKPFAREALLETVSRALEARAALDASRTSP